MIKKILLCYILIVILQFILIKYLKLRQTEKELILEKKIIHDNKNIDKIKQKIKKYLIEITEKLNSGKMNFEEWEKYIEKNHIIKINDFTYNGTAWLKIPDKNDFKLIFNFVKNIVGLTNTESKLELSELLTNSKYSINNSTSQLIFDNLQNLKDDIFVIDFFWVDAPTKHLVQKIGVSKKFQDKTGKTGYVIYSIDSEDITKKYSYKYIEKINKFVLFISSIITIIVTIIIYNLKSTKYSTYKAILFLVISNIYIFLFNNTYEGQSTINNEDEKLTKIRSSILNISFLSGINTFILKLLFDSNKKMFKETAVIFVFGIFFTLLSMYKFNNPSYIDKLLSQRITHQFTFNFAVLLNGFIMVNYLLYVYSLIKK